MTGTSEAGSLESVLAAALGDTDSPVVVFGSLWQAARAAGRPVAEIGDRVLTSLRTLTKDRRTLAMPTFTAGFRNGFCDLDSEPSKTGALTEAFRRESGTRRTLSAFFSFAVTGPERDALCGLRPADAWGEGSLYEWMEERDVLFVMIGTHPTHCSYLHRLEWLMRDRIPYRYPKTFDGRIRRDGVETEIRETLFVRSLQPEAVNDFTVLAEPLAAGGMFRADFRGAMISSMRARAMRDAALSLMRKDPLYCLRNRADFQTLSAKG